MESIKLGSLEVKSEAQKYVNVIAWKKWKKYCENSYIPHANFGKKLFWVIKYDMIELYHSSIQNEPVLNSYHLKYIPYKINIIRMREKTNFFILNKIKKF